MVTHQHIYPLTTDPGPSHPLSPVARLPCTRVPRASPCVVRPPSSPGAISDKVGLPGAVCYRLPSSSFTPATLARPASCYPRADPARVLDGDRPLWTSHSPVVLALGSRERRPRNASKWVTRPACPLCEALPFCCGFGRPYTPVTVRHGPANAAKRVYGLVPPPVTWCGRPVRRQRPFATGLASRSLCCESQRRVVAAHVSFPTAYLHALPLASHRP